MASIRRRGERWQARVVRKGFPPVAKSFQTRGDAVTWARAIERDQDLGAFVPRRENTSMALCDLITRYTAEVVPKLRGAHTEVVRLATINKTLGDYSLAALTPQVVGAYRDARLLDVTPSTVLRELQSLSAMLNHAAREWNLPVSNAVQSIRRPSANRARSRRLEPEEEAKLLEALCTGGRNECGRFVTGARNPWVKSIVLLALETAMRRGELLSLCWDAVDLARRTVFLEMTKNGSARTVPLSTRAVELLATLPRCSDSRVFPVTENALKHVWVRACSTAGIDDLHFHDLRHEATSRLAEKLPNIVELAAVTGHRDVKMLARYYHPRPSELAKKLA